MAGEEKITDACARFAQALCRAKEGARTEDEFWANRRSEKAYQRLFKAVSDAVPQDVKWQSALWEIAGATGVQVWSGEWEEQALSRAFCQAVCNCLDDLAAAEWVACVPLEHNFTGFPECTDFGDFKVVNPTSVPPPPAEELLPRFRSLLARHVGVNFMPAEEVNESYLRLGEHFHFKSGNYVPGRPQMVVRVGRGERHANEPLLWQLASSHLTLLAVCQIAYELEGGLGTEIVSPGHDTLPTGVRMQRGLIEIPGVAVAVNVRTGEAGWWTTGLQLYERQAGTGYDPARFMRIWDDIARPVIELRNAGVAGVVRDAIDNALWLVGRCRHPQMGELSLNSVIATETILNPFNVLGDTGERLALFAATLTESSAEKRLESYKTARSLYRLRSRAVHQARLYGEEDVSAVRKQAFGLFRGCLKGITTWASRVIAGGGTFGADQFKEFYARTVMGVPMGV